MGAIEWSQDQASWPSDVYAWAATNYPGRKLSEAPQWIQDVTLVAQLHAEVFNGGFNQYMYNTRGWWLDELLAACSRVNLPELDPLIREGGSAWLAVFDDPSFQGLLDGSPEGFQGVYQRIDLTGLDRRFYEFDALVDVRLTDYVNRNRAGA